jgi:hypothetical protein
LATITDDVNLVNITQGSIRAIVKGPLPALKKVEVALDSGKFTTSNLTFFSITIIEACFYVLFSIFQNAIFFNYFSIESLFDCKFFEKTFCPHKFVINK